MPALITHHLFGEEAAHALPEGLLEGRRSFSPSSLATWVPIPSSPASRRCPTGPPAAAASRT